MLVALGDSCEYLALSVYVQVERSSCGRTTAGLHPATLWRRYEVRGIYLDLQLVSWNSEVAAVLHTALHSSSDHELIVQFNQLLIIYVIVATYFVYVLARV